jgi:hypothetical protein
MPSSTDYEVNDPDIVVMQSVVCDDCGIIAAGVDLEQASRVVRSHRARHDRGDLAELQADSP